MPELSTKTIVDLLTYKMEKTEIIFDTLLKVKTDKGHELMEIAGVSICPLDRLWVKSSRHNWTEVHDKLLYKDFIISALYERLQQLFTQQVKS